MTEMQYRKIPYVDKRVSGIIYGAASLPGGAGEDGNALLDAVFALGVNTFDTARVYGRSESVLGNWISDRNLRDQVVLLTKCGHPDPDGRKRINEREIRKDFAESAKALLTDYFDIYLLHRDDPEVEAGVAIEIFNALYAEGKIGAFGGSNWTHSRIEAANEYAYKHDMIPFRVSSPNFGLAEQIADPWGGGCVTISGDANADAREWYRHNRMPVVAYSSLGRGLFSGRVKGEEPESAKEHMDVFAQKGYCCRENFERLRRCERLAERKGCSVPQIAMAWIFRQELNVFAVVSTSQESRMRENIHALDMELTSEEMLYLDLKREWEEREG